MLRYRGGEPETMRKKLDPSIQPDMTVLDVVSRYRKTEEVFKRYDAAAGECICCQSLFEPLDAVAQKYGLDLKTFMKDLESVIETETR
jgi:hypothetical protein